MEALAEVMVTEAVITGGRLLKVVQKLKLVNQAIVEHTDLEMMVVLDERIPQVLAGYIILLEAAVLVVLEQTVVTIAMYQEVVEQEKIIAQFLQTKEIQVGSLQAVAVEKTEQVEMLVLQVLAEVLLEELSLLLLHKQIQAVLLVEAVVLLVAILVQAVQALFVLRYSQQIIQEQQLVHQRLE
jgi:hypothetical protein